MCQCVKIWEPPPPGNLRACNGIALPFSLAIGHTICKGSIGVFKGMSILSVSTYINRGSFTVFVTDIYTGLSVYTV
jgi:hypothetical protein